jgi:hypothetical protein
VEDGSGYQEPGGAGAECPERVFAQGVLRDADEADAGGCGGSGDGAVCDTERFEGEAAVDLLSLRAGDCHRAARPTIAGGSQRTTP